jgi:beta-glucosidase
MGGEFRRKGVNIALGPPVIGPLGRITRGGRNWEGFSNDPYHAGILAGLSVTGIQDQGVVACTKHFIGNEQETARTQLRDSANNTVLSSSSNMDDTTLHELYLWPFADAVHAGTGSIMCSYNLLNNSYACQNSKALNGILKTELGFQGFVVSDWGAQHGGVASAQAGMDIVMPSGAAFCKSRSSSHSLIDC